MYTVILKFVKTREKYCGILISQTFKGNENWFKKSGVKGEVHSKMAIYFLYANKKFIQRYVIHQNFSLQGALKLYKIFL